MTEYRPRKEHQRKEQIIKDVIEQTLFDQMRQIKIKKKFKQVEQDEIFREVQTEHHRVVMQELQSARYTILEGVRMAESKLRKEH